MLYIHKCLTPGASALFDFDAPAPSPLPALRPIAYINPVCSTHSPQALRNALMWHSICRTATNHAQRWNGQRHGPSQKGTKATVCAATTAGCMSCIDFDRFTWHGAGVFALPGGRSSPCRHFSTSTRVHPRAGSIAGVGGSAKGRRAKGTRGR